MTFGLTVEIVECESAFAIAPMAVLMAYSSHCLARHRNTCHSLYGRGGDSRMYVQSPATIAARSETIAGILFDVYMLLFVYPIGACRRYDLFVLSPLLRVAAQVLRQVVATKADI